MRLAPTIVLALGCGEPLPSPSTLSAPRILALLTEHPEVRPGGRAEVQAVWFDPQGRAPAFRWWWCWERAGVDPLACEPAIADRALDGLGGAVTVDLGVVPPPRADAAAIVRVDMTLGAETVAAFRRIAVLPSGELHRPLALTALQLEQRGVSTDVPAAGEVTVVDRAFCVVVAADVAGQGRPLTASFFSTGGTFVPPRVVGEGRLRSCWAASGSSRSSTQWVVVRDSKGGVRARSFEARRAD